MKQLSEKEIGDLYDQGKEAMVSAYRMLQQQIVQLIERVNALERQLKPEVRTHLEMKCKNQT